MAVGLLSKECDLAVKKGEECSVFFNFVNGKV
jgi:hypothetical protein